jgi:hypothetical protein
VAYDSNAEADSRENEPASFCGAQLAVQNETAHVPPKIVISLGQAESSLLHHQSDLEAAETEYDVEGNTLEVSEEEPELSTTTFVWVQCSVCGFLSRHRGRLLAYMVD